MSRVTKTVRGRSHAAAEPYTGLSLFSFASADAALALDHPQNLERDRSSTTQLLTCCLLSKQAV